MSGIGTANLEYASLTGLRQNLDLVVLRAFRRTPEKLAKLRALAALDPVRAIEWVRTTGQDMTPALSTDIRMQIVAEIGERACSSNDQTLILTVAETLREQPSLATTDLVLQLAALLSGADAAELLGAAARNLAAAGVTQPELLALAAQAAIAGHDLVEAEQLLHGLSRNARTPAQIREIQRLQKAVPFTGYPVRIALLSSYTFDPVRAWLEVECRHAGLAPEIQVAPFNSWEREMHDPASALYTFDPRIVFLSASLDDLIPSLVRGLTRAELTESGEAALGRIISAARSFRERFAAPLVVNSLITAYEEPAAAVSGIQAGWLADLNGEIAKAVQKIENCYLLDLNGILASAPAKYDDSRLRHLARVRLAHAVLPELARACVRVIVPALGLTRKCIVLDLDNTLWGGVVGEVGTAGLHLGDTSPGSEYVEFQHYLKALSQRGFLLAIASKNNEADALDVLKNHPLMVLRTEDFVAMRINWLPKPENLKSIADELGLGLDSFVFVDDNPSERAQMRGALPQVLTLNLPADAAEYRRALAECPALQLLRVTDEDRNRTQLYHARRAREDARVQAESVDEFLKSLRLVARVGSGGNQFTARIQQLFERTNQFNLTTRRYTPAAIDERAADAHWRIYHVSVKDRFSEHGLVGAAIVEVRGVEWFIENLVLSCRLIGYGAETALLTAIQRAALDANAQILRGEYLPSARNLPAREFYRNHGFVPDDGAAGRGHWTFDLTRARLVVPEWLTVVCDAS